MAVKLDDLLFESEAGGARGFAHEIARIGHIEEANAMAAMADHAGIGVAVMEQIGVQGFDAPNAALLDQAPERPIDLIGDERGPGARSHIRNVISADRPAGGRDRIQDKRFDFLGITPSGGFRSPGGHRARHYSLVGLDRPA